MSETQTNKSLSSDMEILPANPVKHPEDSSSPTKTAPELKTKKKKKKKKSSTKSGSKTVFYGPSGEVLSAPRDSEAEPLTNLDSSPLEAPTAAPQTILTLPVKPDEWFISPATYDRDGEMIAEETFTYLKDGMEIISMPFTQSNFEGLTQLLNERFTLTQTDTEADFFHIRKPLTDEDEADPIMTLTQKSRILATTSLDQKTLKQLIKALNKHVKKRTTMTQWLNRWWGKHKVWRVILMIAALPVVLLFLYSILWGVTH